MTAINIYDEAELLRIARGNIEAHLGDCYEDCEEPSTDSIYDEAYTLAFDALVDAGVPVEKAREVASGEAMKIACP